MYPGSLTSRLHTLDRLLPRVVTPPALAGRYAADPCGYAAEVLHVNWWPVQQQIARLLCQPPYKVLVKASHGVGKTFLAAGIINWFYDTYHPSATITTAPTAMHVRDVLWREVRLQRGARAGFSGPSAPELKTAVDHYAKGFTSSKGEAFQGRHQKHMLFVFDEAVGVDAVYWEATRSMFQDGGNHHWLCIFNPTDTSSQAYQEEALGEGWHVVTMSALDHPNIRAALGGDLPPYPGAVSLAQVQEWLRDWCMPVPAGEQLPTDLEWPPQSGHCWRVGPLFEARVLGCWPSSTCGVWSDALFSSAESLLLRADPVVYPVEIGCDTARAGDDFTAMHVRCGPCSLHHERHNGWSTAQTLGRLKQLCREWSDWANRERGRTRPRVRPEDVLVKLDGDPLGAGIYDHAGGYAFALINAGGTARHPGHYPNMRSELWFNTVEQAGLGLVSLARLDLKTRRLLRRQAMTPVWKVHAAGGRVVERKEETKKRLGCSPDDLDALNLAYWPLAAFDRPRPVDDPRRTLGPKPRKKRSDR